MTTRHKIEMRETLKAEGFKVGDVVAEKGVIIGIKDIETKFGEKTVASVQFGGKEYDVFLNSASINGLIDAFGVNDAFWINEMVSIVVDEDVKFEKKMLVLKPLGAVVKKSKK